MSGSEEKGLGEEAAPDEEPATAVSASGQVIQRGDVLYSGMGAAGLAVIDMSNPAAPVVLETLATKSPVKVLQIMDVTLLVILDDFTVIPLDISNPRHPVPKDGGPGLAGPAAGPPPEPAAPVVEGKVKKVSKGWVILDVGKVDGVEPGMRFAIYGKESSRSPRAIVVVSKVTKHLATAPLPPRGSAVVGDRVVGTDLTWRMKHWFSPFPEPGYFKIALDFKPIIGAGRGVGSWGFLTNLELAYKFKAPAEIALVMMPAGFGSSDVGKGGVFEVGAMAGINWRYIGYTWGLGAHLSVAMKDNHVILLNKMRFGNLDGFHLSFFMTWIVPGKETDGFRRFLPDSAIFSVDVPVRPKLNLYFELGGGNIATMDPDEVGSGWANFILGVRSFLVGSGGAGSLRMSTGLGLGYVWDQTPDDAFDQSGGSAWGPILHLGFDWRM
ncbi:MAG: hypothetical protein JRG91_17590 [Deltaproteobacteria bacterium]|nr:hypothetical protein [Deltaproteobacteria bacterium]